MNRCEHCGSSFEGQSRNRLKRFCSESCRSRTEKARRKRSLRDWADKKREEETGLKWHEERCRTCDAVFPRYTDPEGRQGWRKYCSSQCSKEAHSYKRVEPSPRDCIQCGKSFVSLKGKICSSECREARRQEKSFRGHSISKDEFHALEEAQKGRCKICNKAKKLVIDHCHAEKHVRGLLCQQCNSGLGMFYDNTSFLSAAIEYLSE